MAKNLVIVESPAKAKTIGKFLGRKYRITASMGHLRDLPKSRLGVDIDRDFEPQYINIRGKAELINKLKKEAKEADQIYLATDPDREGEAISWHLAHLLGLPGDARNRIAFNEITEKAVTESIKEARKIDLDLVDAQQARRVLDRIVGYMISPLLWKKVKKGLSAGRVQSVTLRLICDREKQIEEFIPKEYWVIDAMLTGNEKAVFKATFYGDNKRKMEIRNRQQADDILRVLRSAEYKVAEVSTKERKKNPVPPFTTSTLQQEASRKLNYPIKKTMMLAQQLYEGTEVKGHGTIGLITYMRTDSTRISDEAADSAKHYIVGKYGKEYYPQKRRIYGNRNTSQDAHEAIRPAHPELPPDMVRMSLSRDLYKLYMLIWERFMASQMEAAVYDSVTVRIEAGGYELRALGNTVKFAGYTILYKESEENSENEDKEAKLPKLSQGEKLDLVELIEDQRFTQPPPRYTEASLVRELEENGIGRPSTYAPTVSTIMVRGYAAKEKKSLIPTELGFIVNDIMVNNFSDIVEVEFTAKVEKEFDEIENGDKKWRDVLGEFYRKFEPVLKEAEKKIDKVEVPQEISDEKCEICGRNMVVKMGRYGKFLACPGFPECRNIKPYFEKTGVICPLCGKGEVIVKRSKKGRSYYGCANYPECRLISWYKPTGEKCADCEEGFHVEMTFRNKKKVVCNNKNCTSKK